MGDWISLDDYDAVERYIADRVAEAREKISAYLDGEGIGRDDPRREAMIAKAEAETDRVAREAIATYRKNAKDAWRSLH